MDNKKLVLLLVLLLLLAMAVGVILLLGNEPTQAGKDGTAGATLPSGREERETVTSTEIKDIFKHCTRVVESDGAYLPLRFSDERLEDYQNYPTIPYSRCSTGVTMEFTTDASVISFDYEVCDRIWDATFDIYENGQYMQTQSCSGFGRLEYTLRSSGETEITIYFPIAANAYISNLQIGNFTTVVSDNRTRLLVLGDSISQGLFGTNPSDGYVSLLARSMDLEYLNLSVGGEMFRKDALDEGIGFDPDYILVVLGTNDLYCSRFYNVICENVDAYLDRLKEIYPDVPVAVVTPTWQKELDYAGFEEQKQAHTALTEKLMEAAAERGFACIDGRELFPHETQYLYDSVHPNTEGFKNMASNLEGKLIQAGFPTE